MNGIMFHCAWLKERASITLFFLHSYLSDLA